MRGTITVVAAAPNTDTEDVAVADGGGAPGGLFMLAAGLLGLTFARRRFGRAAVSR
jgi:MYXO-CTERM domain-containing protein